MGGKDILAIAELSVRTPRIKAAARANENIYHRLISRKLSRN